MNVKTVNRLNNEYRAYIYEAETIRSMKKEASPDEGLRYQKAAQISGQLATLTTGAEAQRWMQCQAMCQTKMREIKAELDTMYGVAPEPAPRPGAAKANDPQAGKRPTPAKPAPARKAARDDVPEATVESWFKDEDLKFGFEEVAGMDEVKKLLSDCVRDVSMSALNDYLGMPTVHSFFFFGPPGCGKTHIIKAFAYELTKQGYHYMSLTTADVHSKFSGEADKIVRRAFEEAVNRAPCILFMDEVDGICQNRSMPNLSDFNMQLTTTFLTSFSDLQTTANREKKSVIFIGATNYPANVDTAMLDRVELVPIPLPDHEARSAVFRQKFERITAVEDGQKTVEQLVQLEDGFTWDEIADSTECYNQRDINRVSAKMMNMIRSAAAEGCANGEEAVSRLKDGSLRITREMFQEAMNSYVPSPKDDIEQQLNEFMEQMHTL